MNLHLKVWRQKSANSTGQLVDLEARDIPPDCSFLEMLDIVNEDLLGKGEEPIAFDHDCREGICGTCSLTIDGIPHGPSETTTCQLYMRKYKDGDTIYVEPFRAKPVPDPARPLRRSQRVRSHPAGWRIRHRPHRFGAGRKCDSRFPNPTLTLPWKPPPASAAAPARLRARTPPRCSLSARKSRTSRCSRRASAERTRRVLKMVRTMDEEGFGNCSNYYECEAVCPADIPASVMTRLNREFASSAVKDSLG